MNGRRAQANLAVLVVAITCLTSATALVVVAADASLDGVDASVSDRRQAAALARHLVSPTSPTAVRENVVDAGRVRRMTAADLDPFVGANAAVRVRLGNETAFARGDSTGGATVTRLVLAGVPVERSTTTNLSTPTVRVPRGTTVAVLVVDPEDNTTVTTIRAGGRVVRYDRQGIEGRQRIRLPADDSLTLRAETRANRSGTMTVRYRPLRGTPTTLRVTVDA